MDIITDIPKEENREAKQIREKIIRNFFRTWKENNCESCVYNVDQNLYINIRNVSIIETSEHTAKTYASTIALVNHFDEILSKAVKKTIVPAKQGNRNQKQFNKLLIMEYYSNETGRIKVTVGINRRTLELTLYCITKI